MYSNPTVKHNQKCNRKSFLLTNIPVDVKILNNMDCELIDLLMVVDCLLVSEIE